MTLAPVPARRWLHSLPDPQGAVLGRIEDDDRLWVGMKDRFAYVVPERGAAELLYRGAVYTQRPGQLVLKQPGEIYRELRRLGRATFDVVLLPLAEVEAARASLGTPEVVFASPELAADDVRARPLLALHAQLRAPRVALQREVAIAEAATALAALGAGLAPAPTRERPAVRKARAYLREHLTEAVRLDELAAHVRLDKYHLVRAFRAEVGVPPYEYLTHLRIARARGLLAAGWSAGEVAAQLGYCDQSQLHRHFRRLVGTTPGAYARARR